MALDFINLQGRDPSTLMSDSSNLLPGLAEVIGNVTDWEYMESEIRMLRQQNQTLERKLHSVSNELAMLKDKQYILVKILSSLIVPQK